MQRSSGAGEMRRPPSRPRAARYDNLGAMSEPTRRTGTVASGDAGRAGGRNRWSTSAASRRRLSRAIACANISVAQLGVDLPDPRSDYRDRRSSSAAGRGRLLTAATGADRRRDGMPAGAWSRRCSARMKHFDPAGIFARELAECLALQLAERDRLDPAMRALLEHLDLLAQGERDRLMRHVRRRCGRTSREMVSGDPRLEPEARGGLFDGTPVAAGGPRHPDAPRGRRRMAGGDQSGHPATRSAQRELCGTGSRRRAAATRRRASTSIDRVSCRPTGWCARCSSGRTTILKVAAEIIRQQDGFFRRGVATSPPLTPARIADTIEMHESTVSRVTTNKYIATPRGLFELRYFFGSALADAEGGVGHSAEAVRTRIKTLIEAEPANAILSDDRIARDSPHRGHRDRPADGCQVPGIFTNTVVIPTSPRAGIALALRSHRCKKMGGGGPVLDSAAWRSICSRALDRERVIWLLIAIQRSALPCGHPDQSANATHRKRQASRRWRRPQVARRDEPRERLRQVFRQPDRGQRRAARARPIFIARISAFTSVAASTCQSQADAEAPYPAFDSAADHLSKRLRRHKRRLRDHHRTAPPTTEMRRAVHSLRRQRRRRAAGRRQERRLRDHRRDRSRSRRCRSARR